LKSLEAQKTSAAEGIMKKKVLLATNNRGKIERYKKLIGKTDLDVQFLRLGDAGIENIEVVEDGNTLVENALKKAQAFLEKTDLPVLANDTGFYVEGEGFIIAPKRESLNGGENNNLTEEEIYQKMLQFWKNIAQKHGGEVDAAWVEAFVLIDKDKKVYTSESRREVLLTDKILGKPHIQMPIRALYISKTTNKPSVDHSEEEELLELQPVTDALHSVLSNI
jgi:inosine/xanthosine triphosphate pyrophosphatase family protein